MFSLSQSCVSQNIPVITILKGKSFNSSQNVSIVFSFLYITIFFFCFADSSLNFSS